MAIVFTAPFLFLGFSLLVKPEGARERLSTVLREMDQEESRFAVVGPIGTCLIILMTELELRFNHIRGVQTVNGTGQILPIVIGGGMLLVVLWKVGRSPQESMDYFERMFMRDGS
jgi:hypothetical protein